MFVWPLGFTVLANYDVNNEVCPEIPTLYACVHTLTHYYLLLHRPADEYSKWYRFNDTVVDEFVMHDEALAAECFGGTYKSRSAEGSK